MQKAGLFMPKSSGKKQKLGNENSKQKLIIHYQLAVVDEIEIETHLDRAFDVLFKETLNFELLKNEVDKLKIKPSND